MKTFKTIYSSSNFRTVSLNENITVNHNGYVKAGYVSKIFNNGSVRIKFHVWKGYITYTANSEGVTHIPFIN
jgi:hypothetical protein